MRVVMYTLNRDDMNTFKGKIPEEVPLNCGEEGFFTVGGADKEGKLIGLTQFYVGNTAKGIACGDIRYIFVEKDLQRNGVGTKMISKVHSILGKSGINKSMVFLPKKEPCEGFFKVNGYLFTRNDPEMNDYHQLHYRGVKDSGYEQGVCLIG